MPKINTRPSEAIELSAEQAVAYFNMMVEYEPVRHGITSWRLVTTRLSEDPLFSDTSLTWQKLEDTWKTMTNRIQLLRINKDLPPANKNAFELYNHIHGSTGVRAWVFNPARELLTLQVFEQAIDNLEPGQDINWKAMATRLHSCQEFNDLKLVCHEKIYKRCADWLDGTVLVKNNEKHAEAFQILTRIKTKIPSSLLARILNEPPLSPSSAAEEDNDDNSSNSDTEENEELIASGSASAPTEIRPMKKRPVSMWTPSISRGLPNNKSRPAPAPKATPASAPMCKKIASTVAVTLPTFRFIQNTTLDSYGNKTMCQFMKRQEHDMESFMTNQSRARDIMEIILDSRVHVCQQLEDSKRQNQLMTEHLSRITRENETLKRKLADANSKLAETETTCKRKFEEEVEKTLKRKLEEEEGKLAEAETVFKRKLEAEEMEFKRQKQERLEAIEATEARINAALAEVQAAKSTLLL